MILTTKEIFADDYSISAEFNNETGFATVRVNDYEVGDDKGDGITHYISKESGLIHLSYEQIEDLEELLKFAKKNMKKKNKI